MYRTDSRLSTVTRNTEQSSRKDRAIVISPVRRPLHWIALTNNSRVPVAYDHESACHNLNEIGEGCARAANKILDKSVLIECPQEVNGTFAAQCSTAAITMTI